MRTGADYLAAIDDGRLTYFRGKRIHRIQDDPTLLALAHNTAREYDRFHSPEPGAINPLLVAPRSPAELRERATVVVTIEETLLATYLALMSMKSAAARLPEPFAERARAYVDDAVARDIRIAQCISDSKGNRSLPPLAQPDPDAYLRVVERRPDGLVLRGAKIHISGASLCDDLLVMPTKAMKPGEEDYAVACAVPVSAPGVVVVNATTYPEGGDPEDHPVSTRSALTEGFVIFDDVFVPHEMVFLDGQVEYASTIVHSLGPWVRLNGVSRYVRQADELVGLAQLITEANGLERASHVREKIDEMIIHATLLRAGMEAAIAHAVESPEGFYFPDELFTNATKYLGAAELNRMVRHLHDIAGGAIVTAPSVADLSNEDTGELLRKYMQGSEKVSGEQRLRLFAAIRDLTASGFGGWNSVMNLFSGGSLFAQRLVARKHYDMGRARQAALELAGLAPADPSVMPAPVAVQPVDR
ncbi:MAG: 4-hydroxyphenylacetate 3-hydroxylase [Pseudonocardia sp. SCN 72-86]|nr:MAG: 4-hydroxyphenylacetate 3-hydroxylase [Pseudonocardia sp. SCN 72-86]